MKSGRRRVSLREGRATAESDLPRLVAVWWAGSISVTQVGDAASVQLSFDFASDKSSGFIDFHNLLRVNGVWKITNKTATHSSR